MGRTIRSDEFKNVKPYEAEKLKKEMKKKIAKANKDKNKDNRDRDSDYWDDHNS